MFEDMNQAFKDVARRFGVLSVLCVCVAVLRLGLVRKVWWKEEKVADLRQPRKHFSMHREGVKHENASHQRIIGI